MTRAKKQSTEAAVREIRRRTRRKFAPEEKIRIVLEGLRGEQSVSELCRREGIAANLYYRWSKDFLEAGKKQLAGETPMDLFARVCIEPDPNALRGANEQVRARAGKQAPTPPRVPSPRTRTQRIRGVEWCPQRDSNPCWTGLSA